MNDGPQIDHKPQNAIEWYVKIPHHDDYQLWLPTQPNPEQHEWLEALHIGDATMGECRLFDRNTEWYLHVVATREIEQRSTSTSADINAALTLADRYLGGESHPSEHRMTMTWPRMGRV